jgi:hypothetical protein
MDRLQGETAYLAASRRLGTVPRHRTQQPQTYNAQGSTSSQRNTRASLNARARRDDKDPSDAEDSSDEDDSSTEYESADEGPPTDKDTSSEEEEEEEDEEHTYPPKPSLGPPPHGLATAKQQNKVQKQAQKVLTFARNEPTEAAKSVLGVVTVAGNSATVAGLLTQNPALVVAGAVVAVGVNSGANGLNTREAWR